MPSSFARLYRYAKAIGADAKENFTTEALRAAIETDHEPIVEALRSIGIALGPRCNVNVETQHFVSNVGVIDLVLVFSDAKERRVVWVEVKVDAGESGDQLANYSRFIATMPEPVRPTLVVLGPKLLSPDFAWLSRQGVRDAIIKTRAASPYWIDLKTYLEEIRMADNYDEPVNDAEAKALQGARSLMGKLARVLTPFAIEANTIWGGGAWPTTEQRVVDGLLRSFEKKGTLTIANDVSAHIGLSAGLYPEAMTGDAWLGLWIWMNPRLASDRFSLMERARSYSWDEEEWHRDEGEWELFGAYRRLVDIGSHRDGTAWLMMKLTQLRDAGMLDALATR